MGRMKIPQISVQELETKIKNHDEFVLIDVREMEEYEFCKIDSSYLIPLGSFEKEMARLKKEKEYVLMCRSGGRSTEAVKIMIQNGFKNVKNLTGGILQWSSDIDPSLPTY